MNKTPDRNGGGSLKTPPKNLKKAVPVSGNSKNAKNSTPSVPARKTVHGTSPYVKKDNPASSRTVPQDLSVRNRSVQKESSATAAYGNYQRNEQNRTSTIFGFEFGFNKKTAILVTIAVLVVANIFAVTGITQRKIPEKLTPEQVANASKIDLEKMFESPFVDAKVYSSDYRKGTLVLINDTYSFDSDAKGRDIPDTELVRVNRYINDKNFKARDNTTQLCSETVDALNLMFADFTAQGGRRDVMINEAYRSYEDQKSIYDAKVKSLGEDQTIAQKPGYSEHHTGYAVDFSIYPDGGKGARTFTREDHYAWIYENCHKYGFVLRYPEDKTHITGISPESWHFRYVGVPHSSYMYQKGITLEEYLSEIRIYTENVPLTFSVDGTEYGVYYVKAAKGEYTDFKVPKNAEYCISGDNVGGFVVFYKTGKTDNENSSVVSSGRSTVPQETSQNQ